MNDSDRNGLSQAGFFAGLTAMLLDAVIIVAAAPLWIPAMVIHKIKHRNDPKPRGTVRPLSSIKDDEQH